MRVSSKADCPCLSIKIAWTGSIRRRAIACAPILPALLLLSAVLAKLAGAECLSYEDYLRAEGYVEISNCTSVTIAGDHACVLHPSAGLTVIDISDPDAPEIVGSSDTPGQAQQVAVSGTYAFIADGSAGLLAVDISNPELPHPAGNLALSGNALDVDASGSHAYVTTHGTGALGLVVVDISDPEHLAVAGSVAIPSEAYRLVV